MDRTPKHLVWAELLQEILALQRRFSITQEPVS